MFLSKKTSIHGTSNSKAPRSSEVSCRVLIFFFFFHSKLKYLLKTNVKESGTFPGVGMIPVPYIRVGYAFCIFLQK